METPPPPRDGKQAVPQADPYLQQPFLATAFFAAFFAGAFFAAGFLAAFFFAVAMFLFLRFQRFLRLEALQIVAQPDKIRNILDTPKLRHAERVICAQCQY